MDLLKISLHDLNRDDTTLASNKSNGVPSGLGSIGRNGDIAHLIHEDWDRGINAYECRDDLLQALHLDQPATKAPPKIAA
ncbi:hypothetical protein [Aestuariirhabdus sp. LZHN29]|uniref:hypothetical protein n=1 Tax=Aestuariirhabdus sp. LZHN29 TaxID=3417462 RepID=UPI003CEAC14D